VIRLGKKRKVSLNKLEYKLGTLDEFAEDLRTFYSKTHKDIFRIMVCQVWFEYQFVFDGETKSRRFGKNNYIDSVFSFFLKEKVGITHKPITNSRFFAAITSYFSEFFPEFLIRSPFDDPKYYKFPFKHIFLDHLFLVHMCHERMDMLKYAEKKKMSIREFTNWAVNHVLSYNEDVGEEIYYISTSAEMIPFIRSTKYHKVNSREEWFKFDEYEE